MENKVKFQLSLSSSRGHLYNPSEVRPPLRGEDGQEDGSKQASSRNDKLAGWSIGPLLPRQLSSEPE